MTSNRRFMHRAAGLALIILPLLACEQLLGWGRWEFAGGDLHNTRSAGDEHRISPQTAPNLYVKWTFTAEGDVSATPSVVDGAVYFPDWGGWLHKVNAATGARIWSRQISEYTGIPGSRSRNTPAFHEGRLYLGTLNGDFLAVEASTGNLVWKSHPDSHPAAVITQSAIVDGTRVYVGVASYEESYAADPSYPCCTFRGNVVAMDTATGAVVWRTFVMPEGYSGGGVWGSTLVLDKKRNSLYVTTGNNSNVPPEVRQCLVNATDDATAAACIAPDDYFDAMLSLDASTGAIKWGRKLYPQDVFILTCLIRPEDCPPPGGPDYDFGQGAILFKTHLADGTQRELVGAGQKSGIYWALDPDTGATVWSTRVGPGGVGGGMMWGSAMADGRIYAANVNYDHLEYTLPNGQTSSWGNFTALNAATGQIVWQTPDPLQGAQDLAPVTTANGVVFGCSIDPLGHMYAFDASTGALLWTFVSGGSCNAGAAVSNGTVYWGSGYSNFQVGTPNNKLYAFTVP
ncbi:PQQ-binding-like beta-propeller repeat protein [Archangium gephyra]|uniref:outer membrane protein assembly factor BamB family protein n=1 Tax=Archangium gephyra TaxID=48 RepID=UPI0035D43C38